MATRDGTRSGSGFDRILVNLLSGGIRILVQLSGKFSTRSFLEVPKNNKYLTIIHCTLPLRAMIRVASIEPDDHIDLRSDVQAFENQNARPT